MLFIVSTTIKNGKGGISTALVGFCASEKLQQHGYRIVTSHDDNAKISSFLRAAKQLWKECKAGDDVWLHCGPWLSIARKWLLARVARWRGANVYFHMHSPRTKDYLENPKSRRQLRWLLKGAKGIFVLTPWWKKQFEHYLPEFSERLTVLPNPLDPQLAHHALSDLPEENTASDVLTILAMARLIPEKGVGSVLKSLVHLPLHYCLKIAGEGPQLEELKARTDQLNLTDRVDFLGWVDFAHKLDVIAQADVFCLPSRYDSFGMAFIEAMALGKPVVALNRDAIPDVVHNGVTGSLVDQDTPEELAEAIQVCYKQRTIMGANAKRHVLEKFHADTVVTTLLDALAHTQTKKIK